MASFGARLKKEREQKGVTLDDVAQSTKIGTRMLRALEQEQLDQLPGGIFNKGFIRAYARFLGIDEEEVIAEYAAATGPAQPVQREEDRFPLQDVKAEIEKEQATGLPWGTLALLLVVVALGFAIWGMYSREKQNKAERAEPPQQAETQTTPPPVATAPAPTSTATTASPAAKPAQTPSTPTPTTNAATSTAANSAQTPAVAPPHPAASEGSGKVAVTVKAREDSWIAITVDGEVTMQGTLAAGSQKSIHASREISIKAGNAGALDFSFDGKPLPPQGAAGEVKSLVFDANGLKAAPAAQSEPQP